jgi:hypothetical protein
MEDLLLTIEQFLMPLEVKKSLLTAGLGFKRHVITCLCHIYKHYNHNSDFKI